MKVVYKGCTYRLNNLPKNPEKGLLIAVAKVEDKNNPAKNKDLPEIKPKSKKG